MTKPSDSYFDWPVKAGVFARSLVGDVADALLHDTPVRGPLIALDAYIAKLETDRKFVDRIARWASLANETDLWDLPTGLRKILAKLPDR